MGRNPTPGTDSKVINLTTIRAEKIEERRREYERIVFKNTLGVYTVMEQKGLHAIELLDISEGGLSFQVPEKGDLQFNEGDMFPMRFYISTDTYIAVGVKIVRSFTAIDQGKAVHRYGCLIDKEMASYSAIYHFVQFITKCAEHGHKDNEHFKIFY
jgi:hypothetical protein